MLLAGTLVRPELRLRFVRGAVHARTGELLLDWGAVFACPAVGWAGRLLGGDRQGAGSGRATGGVSGRCPPVGIPGEPQ